MWLKNLTLQNLIGIIIFQISMGAFAQNGVPSALEAKAKTGADPAAVGLSPASLAAPAVFGFLDWKSQRVHEAQQKVEQMNKTQNQAQNQSQNQTSLWQEGKAASDAANPTAAAGTSVTDGQKLNFNVDVALQLNVQDYFSMYLKNLPVEDFKEATKKLSTDEVSELLLAYKNFQDKDKKLPLKFSTIPINNAKSKKSKI